MSIIDELINHIDNLFDIKLAKENFESDTAIYLNGLHYDYDRGKFSDFINYEAFELSVLYEIEYFLKRNKVDAKIKTNWAAQEVEIILK